MNGSHFLQRMTWISNTYEKMIHAVLTQLYGCLRIMQ